MSYDASAGHPAPPPGGYGQPGQPGQYNQYSQPGQYGQPGQYSQPGQYGQPGQYSQPAPGYGAPGPYPGGASPYGQPGQYGPQPSNYLGWSIANIFVGFLFSFFILPGLIMGIIATVQSAQVRSKWNVGDVMGAERARKTAKGLNIAVTVVAALDILLIVIALITAHSAGTS